MLNLFSGSVRSVDFSGQYLKAVTLANSKMSELEIRNFMVDDNSGSFKNDESYRWELEIEPYGSDLNDEDSNIQLRKILLKVFWSDNGNTRNLELATLRLDGQTYPGTDAKLEQLFKGGAGNTSTEGKEEETTPPKTPAPPADGGNICGSNTSNISGSRTGNISGN